MTDSAKSDGTPSQSTKPKSTKAKSNRDRRIRAALAKFFRTKSVRNSSSSIFDATLKRYYLMIEQHKIIYCPIEKNACTYFKRLLLNHSEVADEYAESGIESHTFVNQRRKPLIDDPAKICSDDYFCFVVVREPVGRVVSAYLNKFVLNQQFRWAKDTAEKYSRLDPSFTGDCDTLTFKQFVRVLVEHNDAELDVHWRPQSAFFEPVIDYFDWLVPLERVPEFVPILEKRIGETLALQKTHNQNHYQKYEQPDSDRPMYDWEPRELRKLERYPDTETLAAGEIGEMLGERYARDTELWKLATKQFEEKLKATQ